MGLIIEGDCRFHGWMVVEAIKRAQANTNGENIAKKSFGVEKLNRYLIAVPGAMAGWQRVTALQTEVLLARASLSRGDRDLAARAVESAADNERCRTLLSDIVAPLISWEPSLFGSPVTEGIERRGVAGDVHFQAQALENMLQKPLLPAVALLIAGTYKEEAISLPVTNEHFQIYLGQSGLEKAPLAWEEALGGRDPRAAVVGIQSQTALNFAHWLGRTLPTVDGLSQQIAAGAPWEWAYDSQKHDSLIIYCLVHGATSTEYPANVNDLGFRTAQIRST